MRAARWVATLGPVGHLRPAPGTWGSAAALPLGWALHVAGGPLLLSGAIILGFFAGLWATRRVTAQTGEADPSEVVVDELVGQWIALLPLSVGAWRAGVEITALWPGWIVAFVAFRVFDIWKPGPIGHADRRADALGVMLDDVLAGLFAAGIVILLAAVAHIGIMT